MLETHLKNGFKKETTNTISNLPINSESYQIDDNNVILNMTETEYNRRGQGNISAIFFTVLVFLTVVMGLYGSISAYEEPFVGIKSVSDRPIFFDRIGKMQIADNEWLLILYYNLTKFWQGADHIVSYYKKLKLFCHQTKIEVCNMTVERFQEEVERLNYYNSVLLNPENFKKNENETENSEEDDYPAKSIFEILDEYNSKIYCRYIDYLQNNENYYVNKLSNRNTSIVELNNYVLDKGEDNIKTQFEALKHFIKHPSLMISAETGLDVSSVTLSANLLVNSLRKFQKMIFSTLTNSKVHVHLISPQSLMREINEISKTKSNVVNLPWSNSKENFKNIYKLMDVRARVTKRYFLFEVHVPFGYKKGYEIYRAIPLPIKIGADTTYVIRTSSNYIAVDLKSYSYISLTDEELHHKCLRHQFDRYVCPKQHLAPGTPTYIPCEGTMLLHQDTLPCDLLEKRCVDNWIELDKPNTWLAICCDLCTFSTLCNNRLASHIISSTSVVRMSPGCTIESKFSSFYGPTSSYINNKMKTTVTSNFVTSTQTVTLPTSTEQTTENVYKDTTLGTEVNDDDEFKMTTRQEYNVDIDQSDVLTNTDLTVPTLESELFMREIDD